VRLPRWLVGVIDPAQRYMERSSARRRTRRWRRRRATSAYAPLSAGRRRSERRAPASASGPPPDDELRRRVESREARLDAAMGTFGPLLEAAARDLLERGAAEVHTPSATLSARIVRFRWGDSVLEIEGRREKEARSGEGFRLAQGFVTSHRARLSRTGEREDVLVRYLVGVLADVVAP
jgi:hypothetical protein